MQKISNMLPEAAGSRTDSFIEWQVSTEPVGYEAAVTAMEERAAAVAMGQASELVWLLEHPALYTAGTSARAADLVEPQRLPVHRTGRGGQYTYHGPGQRIAYVLLNLKARGGDLHAYVCGLEYWLIAALADLSVRGEIRPGRVGVWVQRAAGRTSAGGDRLPGTETLGRLRQRRLRAGICSPCPSHGATSRPI